MTLTLPEPGFRPHRNPDATLRGEHKCHRNRFWGLVGGQGCQASFVANLLGTYWGLLAIWTEARPLVLGVHPLAGPALPPSPKIGGINQDGARAGPTIFLTLAAKLLGPLSPYHRMGF